MNTREERAKKRQAEARKQKQAEARRRREYLSQEYVAMQQLRTSYFLAIVAAVLLIWLGFSVIQYFKVQSCIGASYAQNTQYFNSHNCAKVLK